MCSINAGPKGYATDGRASERCQSGAGLIRLMMLPKAAYDFRPTKRLAEPLSSMYNFCHFYIHLFPALINTLGG
jgi:hypothetical protein